MYTRLFDADPITRTTRIFHYDPDTKEATIETVMDVEPTIEMNKYFANQFDERSRWKGDLHKVASIPLPLFFELKRKGIIDDKAAFKKWLNDPDNRVFRTRPGRV